METTPIGVVSLLYGTNGARRCLIRETERRNHQLRRGQAHCLIYCVKVRRIETEPNTEGRTSMLITAEDLEYGAVFQYNGRTYVWDGDEYDEDTLWITEVGTYTPCAIDKQEEVELCT